MVSSDPVDDDGTYGGYAKIAEEVSRLNPGRPQGPYSRQAVNGWYLRRESNEFPESHPVRMKSGRVRNQFRVAEVLAWFRANRVPTIPAQEPEMTSPMFTIDANGHIEPHTE